MGLLDAITGFFSSSDKGDTGPHMVIDGRAMLGGRPDYRPSPRDMIALLYRLGRFAEQEKIRSLVVFDGEPLHKAGDGDQFQGVTVFYADSPAQRGVRMMEVAKSAARRAAVTLVCDDAGMEREAAAAGIATLRTGTLRKALEPAGPEYHHDRRDGGDGRRGRRGGGRQRRFGRDHRGGRPGGSAPGPAPAEAEASQPAETGGSPAEAGGASEAAVRRLVDLVDEE